VDVLICVADGVLYHGVDYAARIEQKLAAEGLTSARFDLRASLIGEPPPARAYVFTGGETSVHCDVPWMRSAIDMARVLTANADRQKYAVIGICLGAQLLAEAVRPNTIVSSTAIEVGLTPVVCADDELVQQVVPSFHYQAISSDIQSLAGTRIEWCNDHTAVQAFTYGERTFGCQFHPELSAIDVHNLIDYHASVITQRHGDVASAHQSVDRFAGVLSADLFQRTVVDRVLGVRVRSKMGPAVTGLGASQAPQQNRPSPILQTPALAHRRQTDPSGHGSHSR
jgi:GMP synthase-like glutamine amidotransferase